MGRPTKLKQTVYLTDPESGEPQVLQAGSKPPARLAKLITNPAAWSEEDVEADGRGVVEQSGPYVGLSFDQLTAIAASRDLEVKQDATTDEVLQLVVEDDGRRSEAKAAAYDRDRAEEQAKAAAEAEKAAAAEAKAKAGKQGSGGS
jgi:riboflavin synthase